MDRSVYLARALQAMGQPQQGPAPMPIDPAQMATVAKARKAWEAANPGGNYMAHGVMQAGRNVMAAPGNVAENLGQLPGLFSLGRRGAR